jgi:hypothetical protein
MHHGVKKSRMICDMWYKVYMLFLAEYGFYVISIDFEGEGVVVPICSGGAKCS